MGKCNALTGSAVQGLVMVCLSDCRVVCFFLFSRYFCIFCAIFYCLCGQRWLRCMSKT